ncbi:MAG: leucine-rich repeat protein, partial [Clostridia bacterium]|nr:leucine-rich repeat protein [Clostridia bacterium]
MNNNRKSLFVKLSLTVLSLVFAVSVALFAACTKTPDPDYGEKGTYYAYVGDNEYTFALKDGKTYTLTIASETETGTYTYDGTTFTVKPNGGTDYTVTLADGIITLNRGGTEYKFYIDKTYTVSFNTNNGSSVADQTVKFGDTAEAPADPIKDGFEFKGWYADSACTTPYNFTEIVTANTTVYAKWNIVVSVNGDTISWGSAGTGKSYSVKVTDPEGGEESRNVSTTTYSYAFSTKDPGEYLIEVTVDGATYSLTYLNKGLAKATGFTVNGTVLTWNAVENATKYFVTVVCGDNTHEHANVDNGDSTSYDFATCTMPETGIKFTVTAFAEGYADSVSDEFTYTQKTEVTGLNYNADTKEVSWTAVEGATSYKFELIAGELLLVKTDVESTTYSLKAYTGEYTVTVTANVANAYNASATSSLNIVRIPSPTNFKLEGNVVSWDAVEGATEYVVKVNGVEVSTGLTKYTLTTNEPCTVYVKAVGETSAKDSVYSDAFEVKSVMAGLKYNAGQVSWNAVYAATGYVVKIDDNTPISVASTSCAIEFSSKGEHVIVVYAVTAAGNTEPQAVTVVAREVKFVANNSAADVVKYLVKGDRVVYPTVTKAGYEFNSWHLGTALYNAETFNSDTDIEVVATWDALSYTVKFDLQNGATEDSLDDATVTFGQKFKLPVPTSKVATMVFDGWYSDRNGQGTRYSLANGNSAINWNIAENGRTLYAYWVLNLEFRLIAGGTAYSVFGVKSREADAVTAIDVPAVYKDLPVTTVEANAFANYRNLASVKIPDTIKVIEPSAFFGCTSLAAVDVYHVENNNDIIYTIDNGALIKDDEVTGTKQLVYVPTAYIAEGAEYTIPYGVQVIYAGVFEGQKLSKVNIPCSVKEIYADAFANCTYLTEVVFTEAGTNETEADSLTVDKSAFSGCAYLESITFPARLGTFDFTGLLKSTALESVYFVGTKDGQVYSSSDDGMVLSGDGKKLIFVPFNYANGGEATIPVGVTEIGEKAFNIDPSNGSTYAVKIQKITIPAAVTKIGKSAFEYCTRLNTIIFEGDAEDYDLTIASRAFFYCYQVHTLVLPANLTTLDEYAFADCRGLTEVTVNSTISANKAFITAEGKSFVTELNIGADVEEIEISAIFGTLITNINVAEGNGNFESEDGVLYNAGKTTIVYYPLSKSASTYVVPSTVKTIPANLFKENKYLVNVTIGKGVTSIGESAFASTTIEQLTFEAGGTDGLTIGREAFRGIRITELTL